MRCEGKLKHINRTAAKQAEESTRKRRPGYRGKAYLCIECGFYHVGQKARLYRQQRNHHQHERV